MMTTVNYTLQHSSKNGFLCRRNIRVTEVLLKKAQSQFRSYDTDVTRILV